MRVVTVGDIGPRERVVDLGAEAMFHAMVLELRARDMRLVTALTANVDDSAHRYDVDAVPGLDFESLDRAAWDDRMRDIIAGRVQPRDPAVAVAHAVRTADLVVIGGGSLHASRLLECATVSALAAAAGVPLVVSGQSFGDLSETESALLSDLLRSAALVGVRDRESLAVAQRLGATAQLHVDDASFLADLTWSSAPLPPFPYCLVTLSSEAGDDDRDAFVAAAARLLDRVEASTGLGVVFTGQVAPFGGAPRGDEVMQELVRAAMEQPSGTARAQSTAESAALARGASLVISDRVHPLVFAVSGGVPGIGMGDSPAIAGVLEHVGQSAVLTVQQLLDDEGFGMLNDVWQDAPAIRAASLDRAAAHRAATSAWWDNVAALAVSVPRS